KSSVAVTLMGWWSLTTTDGDLPEDVKANFISPSAPNHWGMRALMGRWLIPSDAPPGESPQPVVGLCPWTAPRGKSPGRVVVRTYNSGQRYPLGDPHVIGQTIRLVQKPYQI